MPDSAPEACAHGGFAMYQLVLSSVALATLLVVGSPMSAASPDTAAPDRGQVLEYLESHRPVFSPRALSRAEQQEIETLAPERNGFYTLGTMTDYHRLRDLAQSGDLKAMRRLRDALIRGFPLDSAFQGKETRWQGDFSEQLSKRLAALWTAHIADLHGFKAADPGKYEGPLEYAGCQNIFRKMPLLQHGKLNGENCGYDMHAVLVGKHGKPPAEFLFKRAVTVGKSDRHEVYVTKITFNPVYEGDPAALERRFAGMLATLRRPQPTLDGLEMDWLRYYARRTGREGWVDDALATGSAAQNRQLADARQRSRDAAILEWKRGFNDPASQLAVEALSFDLGGEYLDRYVAAHVIQDSNRIDVLCRMNHAACQTQRRANGELQAKRYAAAQAEAAARAQVPESGRGTDGVTVRSYDQQGNYQGSSFSTRTEAGILGAKPK